MPETKLYNFLILVLAAFVNVPGYIACIIACMPPSIFI